MTSFVCTSAPDNSGAFLIRGLVSGLIILTDGNPQNTKALKFQCFCAFVDRFWLAVTDILMNDRALLGYEFFPHAYTVLTGP
jgi:hypothetical protein